MTRHSEESEGNSRAADAAVAATRRFHKSALSTHSGRTPVADKGLANTLERDDEAARRRWRHPRKGVPVDRTPPKALMRPGRP